MSDDLDPIEAARRRIRDRRSDAWPPPSEATSSDVALNIKHLLDGIHRRPVDGYWREPKPPYGGPFRGPVFGVRSATRRTRNIFWRKRRMSKPEKSEGTEYAPKWIGPDGEERDGLPEGGYLRMRTQDDMLWLTEHRPEKSGDWGQSIKMYGPFKTADAQRDFMRSAARGTIKDGPQLAAMLRTIDAWVRFDE